MNSSNFLVNQPTVIRFPNGVEKVVAGCFKHHYGVLYLDLFWHQKNPDEAAHLIRGELKGTGPWKISDHVIRLLGCANTDPDLQPQYLPWKTYLESAPDDFPPAKQVLEIVERLGAVIPSLKP